MTQQTPWTLERVLELFDKTVAERGLEYVYPDAASEYKSGNCRYWDVETQSPSCAVGMMMHLDGIDVANAIRDTPSEEYVERNSWGVQMLVEDETIEIAEPQAENVLNFIQYWQDKGKPYSEIQERLHQNLSEILNGDVAPWLS